MRVETTPRQGNDLGQWTRLFVLHRCASCDHNVFHHGRNTAADTRTRHDTPQDGCFVRRCFEIYCFAVLIEALWAAASYAMWGRPLFALGAAAIASAVLTFRRPIIPAMARMSSSIQANARGAISDFRKIHATALLVNLIQLIVVVWGTLQISEQQSIFIISKIEL